MGVGVCHKWTCNAAGWKGKGLLCQTSSEDTRMRWCHRD